MVSVVEPHSEEDFAMSVFRFSTVAAIIDPAMTCTPAWRRDETLWGAQSPDS